MSRRCRTLRPLTRAAEERRTQTRAPGRRLPADHTSGRLLLLLWQLCGPLTPLARFVWPMRASAAAPPRATVGLSLLIAGNHPWKAHRQTLMGSARSGPNHPALPPVAPPPPLQRQSSVHPYPRYTPALTSCHNQSALPHAHLRHPRARQLRVIPGTWSAAAQAPHAPAGQAGGTPTSGCLCRYHPHFALAALANIDSTGGPAGRDCHVLVVQVRRVR